MIAGMRGGKYNISQTLWLKHSIVPKKQQIVIAAGREIVAESRLYITKKRYAALVYDIEGFPNDTDGKAGKVKAMGLDLRRSRHPVFMQEFFERSANDGPTRKE